MCYYYVLLSDSLKVQFQKPYVGISVSEKFNAYKHLCRKSALLINRYVGKMQYCKDYVGLVQYFGVGQVQYPLGLSEKCIAKDCRKTA